MNRISEAAQRGIIYWITKGGEGIRGTSRRMTIHKNTVGLFVGLLYEQTVWRGWQVRTQADVRNRMARLYSDGKWKPEGPKRTSEKVMALRRFAKDGRDLKALIPWVRADQEWWRGKGEPSMKSWKARPYTTRKQLTQAEKAIWQSKRLLTTARFLLRASASDRKAWKSQDRASATAQTSRTSCPR